MKLISRTAAVALVISLPMALGACGNSKPSKADVKAGYVKTTKEQAKKAGVNLPDSLVKKLTGCVIDKTYDDVSSDSLKSIKEGKTNDKGEIKVTSKDKPKFETASDDCAAKYKKEVSQLSN